MHSTVRPGTIVLALAIVLAAGFFPVSGAPAADGTYTAALFPFHAEDGDPTTLERTVTEMVASQLQTSTRIILVDSTRLSALAVEKGLDLSSPLSTGDRRLIAGQAGAEILISGSTRKIDGEVVILARIAGVHTTRSEEVLLSSYLMGRLRPLIARLGEDILRTINLEGGDLLVEPPPPDADYTLSCDQFDRRSLPSIFLDIRESYSGDGKTASTSEAELLRLLDACGFEVAKARREAEIIVFGKGVGGKETRGGESPTSTVDVELRAVAPAKGELLAVARITHSARDRPDSPTGTAAFREAVAAVAPDFLGRMVESWTQGGER